MSEAQLIRCSQCGTTNRVPREKIAQGLRPRCGQCKAPLSTAGRPIAVTDATFAAEVERSPIPVLVDLWAEWCGPCRSIAPTMEQLASEMAGRLKVAKLNVDENPMTAAKFNAQSIPLLLIFKDGQERDRIVGAYPKTEIVRKLQAVLGR